MSSNRALDELARLHGIRLGYRDAFGESRRPPPEALQAVLRSLGVEATSPAEVLESVAARRRELADRFLEPVTVVWMGRAGKVPVNGVAGGVEGPLECHLVLESGESRRWRQWELVTQASPDRGSHRVFLPLPELPLGYHELSVRGGGREGETLLLSAPPRGWPGDEPGPDRRWGVFLPLYALGSARSWGAGDLGDLDELLRWVGDLGGSLVGTLPLYAAFLDEPFDPSPYAPASRLFWNEMYLAVERLPELERCGEARSALRNAALRRALEELRAGDLVDYREVMARKQRLLRLLAAELFRDGAEARREAFDRFLARRPETEGYATFRAVGERLRRPWQLWNARLRRGDVRRDDFDAEARRYHLYVQWAFHEQLSELSGAGAAPLPAATLSPPIRRAGIYLDLPLGAHGSSFDTWSHPELFPRGVAAGAPPDPFFTRGQSWGLPPLAPAALRRQRYLYLRRVLGTLFEHCREVRIDHVMQVHRLFWIPEGMSPADGAYVRYPAEELYAVLNIESHRHRTVVVGENLGTVPPYVHHRLRQRGIRSMFVFQYEASPNHPLPEIPADRLACLNTHDMPLFRAFWEGLDIAERQRLGLLDAEGAGEARRQRLRLRARLLGELGRGGWLEEGGHDWEAALGGVLAALAASPAPDLLITLEDLWGETEPQNVPGTGPERPNWRRKASFLLEEIQKRPEVVDTLKTVAKLRRERTPMTPTKKTRTGRGKEAPREPVSQTAPELGASLLSDDDLHLFNEGKHFRLYDKLGAHLLELRGQAGAYFAVWAPNARSVHVMGGFNAWDKGSHPLAPRGASGIWEGFVPGVEAGAQYKYHIVSHHRGFQVDKADPFAFATEVPPATSSRVAALDYEWGDQEWMKHRGQGQGLASPISIYEVHLGSWRRSPEEPERLLGYREIAPVLARYVAEMGFTHVELMPIMEHPFYGSWGYQSTGYFAPSSRYGSPQDLMFLIDTLHQHGVGVLLDWVPSHFPDDEHGLAYFDGTHLFEHEDPRLGFHPDWKSMVFNYGRNEVRSFLVSSAIFWLDKYHADGLRLDAVASMLYLDYSREDGEWIPNEYGGRENLEAISLLRELNSEVFEQFPDVQTYAEESTAWPMVSRPTYIGGLGFGFKWDMGWMHDTLAYISQDPVHRKYHHDKLTFRRIYAYSENFCLPLSHDEVVHGKGSLLAKMPGDDWQKLANLRLLLTYQYLIPGKKLLFMGAELGQWREWSHESSLDWHLLELEGHSGIQRLVRDLNTMLRGVPALHELDSEEQGFDWIEASDADNSVLTFLRRSRDGQTLVAVLSFTPVVRQNYQVGAPGGGPWREIFNSDAPLYGGSGTGNLGGVDAAPVPRHGRSHSLNLVLPPLGALVFERV